MTKTMENKLTSRYRPKLDYYKLTMSQLRALAEEVIKEKTGLTIPVQVNWNEEDDSILFSFPFTITEEDHKTLEQAGYDPGDADETTLLLLRQINGGQSAWMEYGYHSGKTGEMYIWVYNNAKTDITPMLEKALEIAVHDSREDTITYIHTILKYCRGELS